MSMRLSDTIGPDLRGSDPTGWIGVRNPPTLEPTWGREPLPPSRGDAGDRVVAWVKEKRTPLVAGALSIAMVGAMVGALVGSSFSSPVTAEALAGSPGSQSQQAVPAPGAAPAVMGRPADSVARLAVVAGVSQAWPSAGVSLVARADEAVPVAGSPSLLTASSLPAALSPTGVGEVPPATASPTQVARNATPAAASSPSPAPAPSPAPPVVPVVAVPVVPLTAAEQTAADAAAAADLTAANALAAAELTAANAKASADLTAANAAAAAAATAQAAADAAWAVAHP